MCLALRACRTMAPLCYAAKLDPFLSSDCAPTPSTLAQPKERKGSNFAIWQHCLQVYMKLPNCLIHLTADSATLNGRLGCNSIRVLGPLVHFGADFYELAKAQYRVTLMFADLGCVDFNLDVPSSCIAAMPVLPISKLPKQKWGRDHKCHPVYRVTHHIGPNLPLTSTLASY